jgi:hypothetical protein
MQGTSRIRHLQGYKILKLCTIDNCLIGASKVLLITVINYTISSVVAINIPIKDTSLLVEVWVKFV